MVVSDIICLFYLLNECLWVDRLVRSGLGIVRHLIDRFIPWVDISIDLSNKRKHLESL
jgi:hypothetical protein